MLRRYNQCEGSQRKLTEFAGTSRDKNGLSACPYCGKVLLLRKNDRGWRLIYPTHTPYKLREDQ